MGFFDSMKIGLGAVGDFLGDVVGAGLAAAPTVIPLLQSTGVIPQIQPTGMVTTRGPGGGPLGRPQTPYYALPGGAPVQQQTARNPFRAPVGFPTGQPTNAPTAPFGVIPNMPSFQSTRGGFQQAAFNGFQTAGLDLPFIDIVPQGGAGQLTRLTAPFVPTMAGARAQPHIQANPVNGQLTWFKPAGRPILWSGDLTACKRVGKIAARARRAKR